MSAMRPEETKIGIVGTWLKETFPGHTVTDTFDVRSAVQLYRIAEGDDFRHSVSFSQEFFDDHPAAEIVRLLEQWGVAHVIRSAGPRRVLITNEGVALFGVSP